MKRYGVIAVIAVLVLGLAVYFAACSGGGGGGGNGGGGGGGTQLVSYSTSTQAASGVKSVQGAMSLTNVVGQAANMAGGAVPSGYAPSRRAKSDTSAIASIDSRLKTAVDKMAADFKNPTIKKTIAKARSLKTISNAPISSTTVSCGYSGTFTVSGADNSTATSSAYDITVTYTNCQDLSGTTYDVMNGTLHAVTNDMIDGSSRNDNLTATNLTLASYVSGTLSMTDALNGTFTSLYSINTSSVERWEDDANASFSMTFTDGTKYTFSMNNISGVDVYTPGTASDTEDMTINGSFVFDVSSGGTSVASVTLALTSFDDKWQYSNTSPYPEDEWLNGTISLTWTPSAGADCMPGSLTLSTAAGTPMHYDSSSDYCPRSGTVVANNATIEFGTPAYPQVTVTISGGTPQVFSDCDFIGADTCVAGTASTPPPM
jgi:hypothetical protein